LGGVATGGGTGAGGLLGPAARGFGSPFLRLAIAASRAEAACASAAVGAGGGDGGGGAGGGIGSPGVGAVSGPDPVHMRPGFAAMLKRIEGNGVRVILVETANRFARDIMVQETGWQFLKERGVDLIAADSPGAFIDDTPTSKMIRQLLGVISELEKASLVAKLAGARKRKRAATGHKVEGRKSHAEERPEVVALVKALRRKKPKGGQMSLRAISAELAAKATSTSAASPLTRTRSRRCWEVCREAEPDIPLAARRG
jgi:DNA invertase Pin-like site-specific DNA recombinase